MFTLFNITEVPSNVCEDPRNGWGELRGVLKAVIKEGKATDSWPDIGQQWSTSTSDLLTCTTANINVTLYLFELGRVQDRVRWCPSDGKDTMNSTSTHDNTGQIISSSSLWIQWQLSGMWSSCVCGPRRAQRLNRVYPFHSESKQKEKKKKQNQVSSLKKERRQIAPRRKTPGTECNRKKVPLMGLEEQFRSTLHTMTPPLPLGASLAVCPEASEPLILRTGVSGSCRGETHEVTQAGEVWLVHRCVTFVEQWIIGSLASSARP